MIKSVDIIKTTVLNLRSWYETLPLTMLKNGPVTVSSLVVRPLVLNLRSWIRNFTIDNVEKRPGHSELSCGSTLSESAVRTCANLTSLSWR